MTGLLFGGLETALIYLWLITHRVDAAAQIGTCVDLRRHMAAAA